MIKGLDKKLRGRAQALLAAVNPLGLTDSSGQFAVFSNVTQCYSAMLLLLYSYFPKGYCDLVYFAQKELRISNCEAETLWGRKQYAEINWESIQRNTQDDAARQTMYSIVCGMLKHTNIPISDSAFEIAWKRVVGFVGALGEIDEHFKRVNNDKEQETAKGLAK